MPPKKDTTTKGKARVGRPKGSRLAYDDTEQEQVKGEKKARGRPRKEQGKAPEQSKGKPAGAWMAHVKKTWTAGKKKNAGYSYKQAMTDAKKTYKK